MAKDVIIFTDGDETAYRALQVACQDLGLYPLHASQGNPTPLRGERLIEAIAKASQGPVVVMVDDRGDKGKGVGEQALEDLMNSPDINVLGVVAVAANTQPVEGVTVDSSITNEAVLVSTAVNKEGEPTSGNILHGDTVDVLSHGVSVPVVGLGDPGKMGGKDSIQHGVPVTKEALEEVLRRAGYPGGA